MTTIAVWEHRPPRWRRLLAVVCLFRGHTDSMVALPEHGWGLYAFLWLGCWRCGRTTETRSVEVAPCGECPAGACDGCAECAA